MLIIYYLFWSIKLKHEARMAALRQRIIQEIRPDDPLNAPRAIRHQEQISRHASATDGLCLRELKFF
jgi:hypothetical protein